jgi:CheY-like chemotaxis protein
VNIIDGGQIARIAVRRQRTDELAAISSAGLACTDMPARHDDRLDARPAPLVLVVEDDPETRHFYRTVLAASGYATDEAHNGHQAFEKAVATSPDLVLTDIAVPGLDGIELCRRLRGDARTSKIPVLAVTGYEDRRYPARAFEAGANHVLIKPLGEDVLVAEAQRLIGWGTHVEGSPVRLT